MASVPARAGMEVLERFRLRSCTPTVCVSVAAAESRRSPLDAAYVFRAADVEIAARIDDGLGPPRRLHVNSGYYDPKMGYLVLHGPNGGLVNLETGRVTLIADRRHDKAASASVR